MFYNIKKQSHQVSFTCIHTAYNEIFYHVKKNHLILHDDIMTCMTVMHYPRPVLKFFLIVKIIFVYKVFLFLGLYFNYVIYINLTQLKQYGRQ